jgi:hypothetical protein
VPPLTGEYTILLQRQRFLGAQEPLAIAWNTRQNAATNLAEVVGAPQLGATVQIHWLDPYHPGASYVSLLSATPYPATLRLTANRMLAMGYDGLVAASLQGAFPGFRGTLDARGGAQAPLQIPPLPSLLGVRLFVAMATLQSGNTDVEETSRVTTITIG